MKLVGVHHAGCVTSFRPWQCWGNTHRHLLLDHAHIGRRRFGYGSRLALIAGAAFGFRCVHPYKRESAAAARFLLQASVVLLGFEVNLAEVLRAGRSGCVYTPISITASLTAGLLLGRVLRMERLASLLIASDTALCGDGAIAALAPTSRHRTAKSA